MRSLACAAAAVMITAAPALAQETPIQDWDLVRDDRQKVVMAFTVFDAGVAVTFRCHDGGYDAVIGGLPPAGKVQQRELGVIVGDEPGPGRQSWYVAVDDTMAVSPLPAPLARRLREGGRLQIVVPGAAEGGRNLRYDLQLPASATAIDETLTACSKPLTDPRDAELEALPETGLPAAIVWARRPQPEYPTGRRTYMSGLAVLSCLTEPSGGLRNCVVETEHPRDGGFGRAALDATRRARLELAEGAECPIPTRMVIFRVQFRLAN